MTTCKHVLVVDDDRMIRELIARVLAPEGLTVASAEDGHQAVDLVSHTTDITVAILDWRMPGLTGEKVLDRLVAIRPNMKAIVASGEHPQEVQRAFAGHKVSGFLWKPFKTADLVKAVQTALAA